MLTEKMHGVVLCAGLGSRLRPLTSVLPKPAVPVGDLPAALRNAEQLLSAGFALVHCNTHYLSTELEEQMKSAALSRGWPSEKIRFWNEPEILETGGGIARIVQEYSSEMGHERPWDTLVVSGDIVADIPLNKMLERWSKRSASETALMASLPIDRPRKDVTWVDVSQNFVCGFGADATPEDAKAQGLLPRIFSNHQIISGELLASAKIEKRSSIDLFYRNALRRGDKILHVPLDEKAIWFDIGTPESYVRCLSTLGLSNDHSERWSRSGIQIITNQESLLDSSAEPRSSLPHRDQAKSKNDSLEQSCLDKINNQSWQWLGHMHRFPDRLLSELEKVTRGVSEMGGDERDEKLASLLVIQSHTRFLKGNHSSGLPAQEGAVQSGLVRGYLDVSAPPSLQGRSLFATPLFIPLALLVQSFEPSNLALNNPFWLLITPPKQ
jgi:NDP-sugar pyrophosphorylase family protein